MWVLFDDCFISLVADTSNPDRVQVRSRHPDHLKALFPNCDEWQVAPAEYGACVCDDDYRYMAYIDKSQVKSAICDRVDNIAVGSFRHRIRDALYYDVVNRSRAHLHSMQPGSPYRFLHTPGWEKKK